MLRVLLEAGADLALVDDAGCTALHAHCRSDKPERVQLLLDHGADIRARTPHRRTPLLEAVNSYRYDAARVLLQLPEAASLVEDVDENGRSALVLCALGCEKVMSTERELTRLLACVRLLLERKADVSISDEDDWTALLYACDRGCEPLVALLLEHRADASYIPPSGETALLLACMRFDDVYNACAYADHDGVLAALLQAPGVTPALINYADPDGHTVLSYAVRSGVLSSITALLAAGGSLLAAQRSLAAAEPTSASLVFTALQQAVEKRRMDVLSLLLARPAAESQTVAARGGAIVDGDDEVVSADDFAALLCTALGMRWSCFEAVVCEMVSACIDAGADCSRASSRHRCTPMYFACNADTPRAAALLLERGAAPGVCLLEPCLGMAGGSTALMVVASKPKHEQYFELFLPHLTPALVKIANDAGETALHIAVMHDQHRPHVINPLLAAGALVDARTAAGYTPLLLACSCGSALEGGGRLLLDHRADLHAVAADGTTALIAAADASRRRHRRWARISCDWGFLLQAPTVTPAWVNARRADGETALSLALMQGSAHFVGLLLEANADVSLVPAAVFHHAAGADKGDRMMQSLMAHNADVSAFWDFKQQALIDAVRANNVRALYHCLHAPVPPIINHRYKRGQTVLFFVCDHKGYEVLHHLLAAGADPSIPNDTGTMPVFQLAATSVDALRLVFQYHPRLVNRTNKKGACVFMLMCTRPLHGVDGLREIWRFRAYLDADVAYRNRETLLHIAESNGLDYSDAESDAKRRRV
jgi:ankyrin repeat protein